MITIFLRKITGKGEKLQVNPKITAAALIKEVSKALNCDADEENEEQREKISCFYRGAKIEGSSESI